MYHSLRYFYFDNDSYGSTKVRIILLPFANHTQEPATSRQTLRVAHKEYQIPPLLFLLNSTVVGTFDFDMKPKNASVLLFPSFLQGNRHNYEQEQQICVLTEEQTCVGVTRMSHRCQMPSAGCLRKSVSKLSHSQFLAGVTYHF